jgi:hypothetical protein
VSATLLRGRTHWYVTAAAADRAVLDTELSPESTWVGHAKRTGTLLTACGLNCSSWPKFLDLHFRSLGGRACEDCTAVVRAVTRG